MPAKNLSINLISQDSFSSSIVGKILLWALSIGRYIVVFTELIVILSFLSRFKLDRDLTDLNSDIAKQSAIIESYGNLEQEVRLIQKQLELIRQKHSSPTALDFVGKLEKITPQGIHLRQLTIKSNTLQLTAAVDSADSLRQFITLLSAEKDLQNLQLTSISTNQDDPTMVAEMKAEIGSKTTTATAAKKAPAKETSKSEDL